MRVDPLQVDGWITPEDAIRANQTVLQAFPSSAVPKDHESGSTPLARDESRKYDRHRVPVHPDVPQVRDDVVVGHAGRRMTIAV
jgi:hypothetical protein